VDVDARFMLERFLNQLDDGFPVVHASLLHELSALPARMFRKLFFFEHPVATGKASPRKAAKSSA
jgi:hypothetical protein